MNHRHVKILLEGCHQSHRSCIDNVKLVGENGNAAYINGCVLIIIAPWLCKPLSGRVTCYFILDKTIGSFRNFPLNLDNTRPAFNIR